MGSLPRDSSQGPRDMWPELQQPEPVYEPGILVASVLPWPTADKT